MKIQILDRYEPTSEWHEIYVNGWLLFEGEQPPEPQFQIFVAWLKGQTEMDVEVRAFTVEYEQKDGEDYMPPVRAMTDEIYWSDWEKAEGV